MTGTALSKLQYLAIAVASEANLFLAVDMAHLDYCIVTSLNQACDAPMLIANVNFYFKNWSLRDHQESHTPWDDMPEEIVIAFRQDEHRKLTGTIECSFIGTDPTMIKEIAYIRGW